MKQVLKGLSSFPGNPISWVMVIVFLAPVFLLTIKSWVTTSLFLLFFICLWPIFKHPKKYFRNRSNQFWALLACLLTPFFAELFAQMGRGEIVGSSLDGPARMILSAAVYTYLSRTNCSVIIRSLGYGSIFGILGVWLSITIFPDYYWGNRAATYFVDPITLPCFTAALLGLVLFSSDRVFFSSRLNFNFLMKAVLISIVTYVSLQCSSRSAWVAIACLLATYIIYSFRYSLKAQAFGIVGLISGLIFLYLFSDTVYLRTNASVSGVVAFLLQDQSLWSTAQHTSSGHRMIMGLIDIELIKINPFFGFGDRSDLPSFEDLQQLIPMLTRQIYDIKAVAGSHSELLAQLVRQGLIFGCLTLVSLFFYPLYLFLWRYRKLTFVNRSSLAGAIGVIVPIFISSITIQVFNLKMTISFYGLCLAIFFAYLCHCLEAESTENPVRTDYHKKSVSEA